MTERSPDRLSIGGGDRNLPGLSYKYAVLAPHPDETVTGAGQIGVSFSAHHLVRYRVGTTSTRGSHPAGSVICSGADPIVWSHVAEPTEALEMYPDPGLLEGAAAVPCSGWPIESAVVGCTDPVVVGVAAVIRRAHVSGSAISDIAGSTLALLLARRVLSHYGGIAVDRAPKRHATLEGPALATVRDLVASDLGDRITLDRLAGAVNLSPFHFARAFKATVGLAPYAFVTALRMDQARHLLRTTNEPVEAIAARVGYANLSHFRRVFRAHAGATPAAYRTATSAALRRSPA